jgi:amino acid adenylation domain-containing protein
MPFKTPFVEFRREETELSVPQHFERQVVQYPDKLAVKTTTREISYAELNKTSNRLARAIVDRCGVACEPIAMVLDHGASSVIGFLAILKAGKICVPLDPAYPPARLQYLIQDSQARLVVGQEATLSGITNVAGSAPKTIDIHAISADFPDSNLDLDLGPDCLAMILYTSGSTGQPKGVVQNHRNVLFEICRVTNSLHISSNDRISHLLACSVAGGVREIFSALLNGAALLPFDIKREGLSGLGSWLIQEKITVCRTVSTAFRTFISSLSGAEQFSNLRVLYVGGETVSKKDFESYHRHFPAECTFVNVYGATETGIILRYFVRHDNNIAGAMVPVGFPSEEAEVSLLDETGRQVLPGQTGEISVKSRYLAVGYWLQPALTAAAFARDPEGTDRRIYRTGDLGRMLSDGSIEYVGRKDFQAEIRGHRIEVAEVEAALLGLPYIMEAVVVSRRDVNDEQRLLAYVVLKNGVDISVTELHQALFSRVPDYMVPSAFIAMNALPLIGIGKVDRSALPEPDLSRPVLKEKFQMPRTPVEIQLARIWAQILCIFPIGINDNFFELGGNSLLAIQLTIVIEEVFKRRLLPAVLFQAPTIVELAAVLQTESVADVSPSLIPLNTDGSKPPFFWVHGDSSNILLPRYLGADQPLYGLEHQSQDGQPALFTKVETIASHYLKQIKSVQPKGPYFLGGYSFGGTVAFEIAQQLQRSGEQIRLLFILDSHFPGTQVPERLRLKRPSHSTENPARFGDHLKRHVHLISGLTTHEKLRYVRIRVIGKLQGRFSRITKTVKTGVCWMCGVTRRTLPPWVRSHYILRIYYRAISLYVAQPYSGHVVYVRSEERRDAEFASQWKNMAQSFELYDVPDSDHMSIIRQPYGQVWAPKLQECLRKVQAKLPRQALTPSGSSISNTRGAITNESPSVHLEINNSGLFQPRKSRDSR